MVQIGLWNITGEDSGILIDSSNIDDNIIKPNKSKQIFLLPPGESGAECYLGNICNKIDPNTSLYISIVRFDANHINWHMHPETVDLIAGQIDEKLGFCQTQYNQSK